MTAVPVERDAVLQGLNGNSKFEVLIAGVGSAAAAASTARALATGRYSLVVSAGIAGGFPKKAEVGSLVLANEIIAADLGVETAEGFTSLDELGFGTSRLPVNVSLLNRGAKSLRESNLVVNIGPVSTVSTVTGTAARAEEMAKRVPGIIAEAMEGYGVAMAAQSYGIPVLEVRAISNLVGPRDRDNWRIKDALDVLAGAFSALLEVF